MNAGARPASMRARRSAEILVQLGAVERAAESAPRAANTLPLLPSAISV